MIDLLGRKQKEINRMLKDYIRSQDETLQKAREYIELLEQNNRLLQQKLDFYEQISEIVPPDYPNSRLYF
jgi:phage shock protein A